jgi:hypothetical protein
MATLTTNTTLRLQWQWTQPLDLSDVVDTAKFEVSLPISDAAIANIAWQDSRTIPANTVDAINLSSLVIDSLGIYGTISMQQASQFYLRNKSTAAGSELRIGTPADGTATTYALSVGRGSYVFLSSVDGWVPSTQLRIANPTGAAISYDIAIIGTGITVTP